MPIYSFYPVRGCSLVPAWSVCSSLFLGTQQSDLRTSICPCRIRVSRHGWGCTAGPSITLPSHTEKR